MSAPASQRITPGLVGAPDEVDVVVIGMGPGGEDVAGRLAEAVELLEQGVPVNERDSQKATAAMAAAFHGRVEVLRELRPW